jgi:predicted dehydrogenase
VDLLRHLAASPIVGVQAAWLGGPSTRQAPRDTGTFTLHCADGSIGTVHYLANGHRAFPKERLDVFGSGRSLHLDNFRRLRGYGWPGFRKMNLWTQDKGQTACVTTFLDAIRHGRPAPIPFEELLEVSRVTIQTSQQQTDRPAHT